MENITGTQTSTKLPHRRSRQGCLTCRKHRLKCDEKSPECGACSKLGRSCTWGLNIAFHPSRTFRLSASERAVLQAIEEARRHYPNTKFVHETQDVQEMFLASDSHSSEDDSEDVDSRISAHYRPTPGIAPTSFHENLTRNSVTWLQSPYITAPQSITRMKIQQSIPIQDIAIEEFRPVPVASVWPVNNYVKSKLLALYLQRTSRWLEATDSKLHFSSQTGHFMNDSQTLAAAAVTLGSTQYIPDSERSAWLSEKLYKFSVSLQGTIIEQKREGVIAALILSVYSASVGNIGSCLNSLRHFAGLLKEYSVDKSFPDLPSASFWTFIRLDIFNAYFSNRTTLLSPENWLGKQYESAHFTMAQDSYANRATWLLSRVINELKANPGKENLPERYEIWRELQLWLIEAPQCMRPLVEVVAEGENDVATILFASSSAVCGNIIFHVACVLLLDTGDIVDDNSPIMSSNCHSGRAVAIAISNEDEINLISALYSVYAVAHHITKFLDQIAVVNYLKEVERRYHWRTAVECQRLQSLWGMT